MATNAYTKGAKPSFFLMFSYVKNFFWAKGAMAQSPSNTPLAGSMRYGDNSFWSKSKINLLGVTPPLDTFRLSRRIILTGAAILGGRSLTAEGVTSLISRLMKFTSRFSVRCSAHRSHVVDNRRYTTAWRRRNSRHRRSHYNNYYTRTRLYRSKRLSQLILMAR